MRVPIPGEEHMPLLLFCMVRPLAPTSRMVLSSVGLLMTVARTVAAQKSSVPTAFA